MGRAHVEDILKRYGLGDIDLQASMWVDGAMEAGLYF